MLCTMRLYCEDYLKECLASPGCLHSSMDRGLLRTTTRTRVNHLFIRTNTGRTHPNRIDRLHEHSKDHVRAVLHGRLGMEPQTPAVGPRLVLSMGTSSDSETTLRVGSDPPAISLDTGHNSPLIKRDFDESFDDTRDHRHLRCSPSDWRRLATGRTALGVPPQRMNVRLYYR